MINRLIERLQAQAPLSEAAKDYLRVHIPLRRYDKQALLLRQGEVSQEFYYIVRGTVRLYYTVGIEEKTAYFYTEDSFVSSYESFTQQRPSKHNLETIEASELAVISVGAAQELLSRFPSFEFLARVMMEEELAIYQDIIASFVTSSAEERYLHLMRERPELLQRIPQYHLATFLGVAPETLSRIRKRITARGIS